MTDAEKERGEVPSTEINLLSVLAFEAGQQTERGQIVKWINRYGDELARMIDRTRPGPLRTSAQGEFSAVVTILAAIERLGHHNSEGREG